MIKSAIILAGGMSKRFGRSKALVELHGKPLILYVIETCARIAQEIIAVVSGESQRREVSKILPSPTKVIKDERARFSNARGPLVGLAAGLMNAKGDYAVALSCDSPFVNVRLIDYLFFECKGRDATVPIWPNGYLEPLVAVYRVKTALRAAEEAIRSGRRDLRSMIERLREVAYVPIEALRKFDPDLRTFININSPEDLEKVSKLT